MKTNYTTHSSQNSTKDYDIKNQIFESFINLSLKQGLDVIELPDNSILTLAIKVKEAKYIYNNQLKKMIKISSHLKAL